MNKTARKPKFLSLILVCLLVFTAIFGVAFARTAEANGSSASIVKNADNFRLVKSDMNFDSIREQYFNRDLLKENVASYEGDRWVIVELDGGTLYDAYNNAPAGYANFASYAASADGKRRLASIREGQLDILSKIEKKGIDFSYKYSYTALTNAIAIKVNSDAFNTINKMAGVKGVYYSDSYAAPKAIHNNANVYTTGIYNSKDIEYKGEGMVVAVLDTGLDYTHEAFQKLPSEKAQNTPSFLTKEKVDDLISAAGVNFKANVSNGYRYSEKVPFSYDYADDDTNVYPAYSSHGTHVAGIVAGSSKYVVNEETKEEFIGVAPEAQLVICKVFTDNLEREGLGGADTTDILAAINDCTLLGVDVINMSLGTSAGFTDEKSNTFLSGVYDRVRKAGISLVVAASNDYSSGYGGGNGTNLASNPDSGTVGSPSTYDAALSVASINGQLADYIYANDDEEHQSAFITTSSDEFGVEYEFINQMYAIASQSRGENVPLGEDLHFKYVVVPYKGRIANYSESIKNRLNHDRAVSEGFDGTIALVERGDNTFAEKVQAAKEAGADACIIYNNVAGVIRMSLGDVADPIPTCSISMDAGKAIKEGLGKKTYGTITINSNLKAGPFMSDFSSWGPTPSLELKPEITAHGGEITSAVAGGYDKYSGTSMASPNMAGAVALLRQYLKSEYGLQGMELNARINQVLMSTATIALNEYGDPYSPRKQGAGLAGIKDAIEAEGYITVSKDGAVRDKTKVELYDDKEKRGIYEFSFTVHNVTGTAQTYSPKVYVMTETMSSDDKTVAERAYILNDNCSIEVSVGGQNVNAITVPANGILDVNVRITLNGGARQYLDSHFVNGMYVEGFVSLVASGETKKTLGLPYLAFYGDWTKAPLFDYDTYELAESQKDTEVLEENKLKASAADTKVYGMYYKDKYILPLGTYIYAQSDDDIKIYPEREKIAISMFDDPKGRTIYELYMIYAGLLRGAAYMDVSITDSVTGEVVYYKREENVSKSYAAGGGNRGAFIPLEIRPGDYFGEKDNWNLKNNSTYNVSIKGELDYGYYVSADGVKHGATTDRNSFDFQFTVDYEDPEILGYRIRYMPYTENKVVKYHIYLDVDVRDNQFVSAVLPCYITERPTGEHGKTESVLQLVTEYPIPVYGKQGQTSTVSFEITDIYDDYVKTGNLYLQVEDYAMNAVTVQVAPGFVLDDTANPEAIELIEDDRLVKTQSGLKDENGNEYSTYNLRLTPNEVYSFNAYGVDVDGNVVDVAFDSFQWELSNNAVKAQSNQIFTGSQLASATATLKTFVARGASASAKTPRTYAVIRITSVLPGGEAMPSKPTPESIVMNPVLNGEGWQVNLNTVDTLEINPDDILTFEWSVLPWYSEKPEVTWTSSNTEIITVDANGKITPVKRGTAYVTVTSKDDDRLKKSIRIVVGREFRVNSYTLYDYYGEGEVFIPENLNIMYLDEDCFKGDLTITKVVLPKSLTEIPENAFKGCENLVEIVIPGQCTTIKANAFEGCTSLKTITLGKFVDADRHYVGDKYFGTITLGNYAFKNCMSLDTIQMYSGTYGEEDVRIEENSTRLTALGRGAFEGCISLKKIDISEVRFAGAGVFKGCSALEDVTTSTATVISSGMFENCGKLTSFTFKSNKVSSDTFKNSGLTSITFEAELELIENGAFMQTKLQNVTLPNGHIKLEAGAFGLCGELTTVTLSQNTVLDLAARTPFTACNKFESYALNGASNYYSEENGALYSLDKSVLVAVPVAVKNFELPVGVTSFGDGALANINVSTLDLSGYTGTLGAYTLSGSRVETVILPNGLTSIPEGLFAGCTLLKNVTAADNFANVVKIGKSAFFGCRALQSVNFENATVVEDSAFENCTALTALPSSKLTTVGMNAFASSRIQNVELNSLVNLGERAFANISALQTVKLGAIAKMGEKVFVGSNNIKSVFFAAGTAEIASYTFNESDGKEIRTDITVILPDSVTKIGDYAFYNLSGLTAINLKNVTYVGEGAFFGTKLSEADLSSIVYIGDEAFAYTMFKSVNLSSAEVIGDMAFYDYDETKAESDKLSSVTFGAVKRIGSNAFSGTALKTVNLPASFNARTYDFSWDVLDDKDRVEEVKTRREASYGEAAFTDIDTLESINISENDAFVSIDGVLYSKVENGLVLEQYPAGKADKTYKVADKTVAIRASAFESVLYLESVEFPYTVKMIGSYAFYQSSVISYTFNSVKAPVLQNSYFSAADVSGMTGDLHKIYSREDDGLAYTEFYANFGDLSIFLAVPEQRTATVTIPLNGVEYDGIWESFFKEIITTDEILPDDNTHAANEAIAKLPEASTVANLTLEDIRAKGGIGEMVQEARKKFNLVTNPKQLEFVQEAATKLLALEKALRERKAALGAPAHIVSLNVDTTNVKNIYEEGDNFDTSGLKVIAIYDDLSEVEVTSDKYSISPMKMTYGLSELTLTYDDGTDKVTAIIRVLVNAKEGGGKDGKGMTPGLIVVCVVVPVIVIAGVAVAVILILKKKKKGAVLKTQDVDNANAEGTANADHEVEVADVPEQANAEEEVNETNEVEVAENANTEDTANTDHEVDDNSEEAKDEETAGADREAEEK